MFGRLGHRSIDLLVLFFALYAFAFVPLGRRTGLEHLRSIIATREAREAGEELAEAGGRLRERVIGEALGPGRSENATGQGRPVLPQLPRGKPVQMKVVAAEVSDAGVDASLTE